MSEESPESFGAFSLYRDQQEEPTHWLAALFGSSVVYVLLGIAAVTIGTAARRIIVEPEVEVKFVEEVAKPEPPPPKPVEFKPPPAVAPPAAAPIVPKDMKVKQLDAPPPAKELVAPDEMPNQIPAEADPALDKGIAVYGEGGDVAGLEGGIGAGVAGGIAGLIRIPEEADPAVPSKSNRPPVFPEVARKNKDSDTVVLRVLIRSTGEVSEVTVLSGKEPFVAAAVKAVKQWRYRPARFEGQPITTFKIIRIPFKLTA